MVRAQMEITKCPFGYLFLTEIELLSAECGFENLEAVEWLISNEWLTGKSLHERCWSGYVAARVCAHSE